ncbi:MAG: enoyl-CoA hydratase/isomerase family protein [Candidatus Flexifilum sp.]|jgi:2-(1,2-epoxy-1,2-dihydrophenyl)acetyl-CoA isomerase
MTDDVLLVSRHDSVTVIAINRPEVRNAVDDEVMIGIRRALAECEQDNTRVVVLTGTGGAFSSGADIKKAVAQGVDPENTFYMLTEVYGPTLKAIRACPLPVIAAVDGYAAGIGCDMALACDLRLVSARARFAELFIRIGLIPDGGGTYLLPRLVGTGLALEMMFTGRDVDAEEAVRIGLANQIYPVDNFLDEVIAYAQTIAAKSPMALRLGKRAMLAALDSSYDEALAREAEFQKQILSSEDGPEGFLAFVEKRAPVWKGR